MIINMITKAQTAVLLGILRVSFPRFYANATEEDMEASVSMWAYMLSDTTFEIAQMALQRLIATSKFPPTVADMRESIATITTPALPDSGEAWGEVVAAIRNYGYYRPKEGMESLSEPVLRVVKQMGWRDLCLSENQMADRAHFLKIYEAMQKRAREERLLPDELRGAIEKRLSAPDALT